MKLLIWILTFIFTGFPTGVQADLNPMVEIHSATDVPTTSDPLIVQLGVRFGLSDDSITTPGNDTLLGDEQVIWATVKADLGFSTAPEEAGTVLPTFFIEVIPVHNQIAVLRGETRNVMGDLELIPITMVRDTRLDQNFTLEIDVLGIWFAGTQVLSPTFRLYGKIAAEALGYKLATHLAESDLNSFNGFHLGDVSLEGGVGWEPIDGLVIKVSLGGIADIALGGVKGVKGGGSQSDIEAFLAARAYIKEFLEIYLKGDVRTAIDTANSSSEFLPRLVFGVGIKF